MFTVSFQDGSPLYEQLYLHIRGEIESGAIKAGEKLPSKRSLAAHLRISVVTVETAYSILCSEGYIYSQPGSGFYAERLPSAFRSQAGPKPVTMELGGEEPAYELDFRTNRVDPHLFPFSVWAKLSREVLSSGGEELLLSSPGQGSYKLRQAIAGYLRSFRGMDVLPEQVVVGAGGEYLTGLLIQLLGRDMVYGVENPGYIKTQRIFSANCPHVEPIEIDASGAALSSLLERGIQVAHITPSHQFPLGAVMPAARRHQILAWAWAAGDRYIIEDDYDSDFRFYGRPVPSLQSLDGEGRVVYLNTFTKSLAPSMRIGYMVIPPSLLDRFRDRLGFYACTVPVFEQLILARFIEGGHFERHISRMRKLYLSRRAFFLKSLEDSPLSGLMEVSGGSSGMHLVLSSRRGVKEGELVARAKEQGVRVYGLSEYYGLGGGEAPPGRVIAGYGGLDQQQIAQGIKALERAWL